MARRQVARLARLAAGLLVGCPLAWPVMTTFSRCFTRDLTHREADPLG